MDQDCGKFERFYRSVDGLDTLEIYRCAECHSTNYAKNYDPVKQSYSSTWTDMNVSCEACHGPGEAHAAWAKAPDIDDPSRFSGTGPGGLTVDLDASATDITEPKRAESRRTLGLCQDGGKRAR